MDRKTLAALIREATLNYKRSKKIFFKTDNCEAMQDMESWASVINWLKGKLAEVKP